ncbi:MAG: hypothetical protein WCN95_15255, partial [bacterium]
MKTVVIVTDSTHPTLTYAAVELRSFLEQTTNLYITLKGSHPDYLFTLVKDPALKETSYAVRVSGDKGCTTVTLSGHNEACVLHAVYEMLERCGICFDILNPILPAQLDLSALVPGEQITTPFVKQRGIRQHINFAMDISSYPLAEALEYIRNMARMRMNHITFHSYSGQWFGYTKDGTFKHGGNFFYGTRFDIPSTELFSRNIRNRAIYCIPEIETVVEQPEVRSRMATGWLNTVMAECKRCGLHVQLSIEPPGETHEEGVAICREVMKLYPLIDTLELVTPECGNSNFTPDVAGLKAYLVELFGASVLEDKELVASLKDNLYQIEGGLRHCARNIKIVAELTASPGPCLPAMAIGAYITCPDCLRVLHFIM